MSMVERLYEFGRTLPPSALAELLDFAEFLQQKNSLEISAANVRLVDLAGGLEGSSCFAGDPLAIQEGLRLEWN
ncbi:DUF2281 domain-containing protein [Desulfobotulus mexicanus]|uniref:DUF2281 domain-containing protein n=1 Tax=Desulfobotulus mexicanus TaxID=2586642 RepID=A0A5S5MDT8_9BACT|nr:DUF2281 domain-containing protein [Desulfobotulus mexicanus]TYT73872.1 DUF2281 domain-containing protein [Desulfobotulus mexicanus]